MTSFERLEALRNQNRELLAKLKCQTEKLQNPSTANLDKETETPEISASVSSRASSLHEEVCKSFSPDEDVRKLKQPSEAADQGNIRLQRRFISTEQTQPESVLLTRDDDDGKSGSSRDVGRVTRLSPDHALKITSERRPVQPLLGYDWIAGLLDAESSLTERSEQFFSELRSFRRVNREECVHRQISGLPVEDSCASPEEDAIAIQERSPDTHECTFCYRINSRLFAVPLDPQAACPVCKMPKDKHPHTEKEPAFVRVSIPRSTLLPAYRYKAHHRNSFNPSDSLGLPSHCLSGWSNITPKSESQMSSLDLRSSMIRPAKETVPAALSENQPDSTENTGPEPMSSDRLMDVSRLARYRFQHLDSAMSKPKKSSYPVF